ncbi:MAG: hypothetical protein KDC73_12140 [Ignavibacteriae bacterium]|nr:hypothetical protein [Ignavibacteriota bacterium]MCB9243411.1 hypothetical protein [Ignavibacteriales bacterium]
MLIEVSNGEIIDKLTILTIKLANIQEEQKLGNIRKEFDVMYNAAKEIGIDETNDLYQQMLEINSKLWDIEDKIRDCESRKDFGEEFVKLARSVYITNDERSRIKREINLQTGSSLIEEKSYKGY